MKINHGLVPTRITDRNGKQTTVYKKPTASHSPVLSIPAPNNVSPRAAQMELLAGIFKEIDDDNRNYTSLMLSHKLQNATNEELTILTDALGQTPELAETLAVAAKESHWETIVSLAMVYDPEYGKEPNPQRRMHMLQHALEQAYARIKDEYPRFDRSLADESIVMRRQAQRYVAAKAAYYTDEVELSDELIDRLLDHSRTDHDATLEILRANPRVTIEQIDFALAGGTKSLSSGAL